MISGSEQLQLALSFAALSVSGGPVILLWAFIVDAIKYVRGGARRTLRAITGMLGSVLFMVLAGVFLRQYLPGWWPHVVNVVLMALTFWLVRKHIQLWSICRQNEWTYDQALTVLQLCIAMRYKVVLCDGGAILHLMVDRRFPITRRVRIADYSPADLVKHLAAAFEQQGGITFTMGKINGLDGLTVVSNKRARQY